MSRSVFVIFAIAAACQSASAAPAVVSPAKQEIVRHVLQLWHVENIGLSMLEKPAANAMAQARVTLQGRAPADRQDDAMRDITIEVKKFLDDATPVVKTSMQTLIPVTLAPLLAERFTEEELRQLVEILESPVKRKFESMAPEMQKILGEKIASDTRVVIDPKIKELTQRVGIRLRAAVTP